MAKMGRPSKFDTIDLEQVKRLATAGKTDKEMAEYFKVALSTWSKWKVEKPDFMEALKGWKDEADKHVEESLYKRAMGYCHEEEKVFCSNGEIVTHKTIKHYPPDTTACIFWLKNRQPDQWREKQEVQHSGEIGTPEVRIIIEGENGN